MNFQLLNRTKSFCKVQQEERDAVLARHHDQAKAKAAPPRTYDSESTFLVADDYALDNVVEVVDNDVNIVVDVAGVEVVINDAVN